MLVTDSETASAAVNHMPAWLWGAKCFSNMKAQHQQLGLFVFLVFIFTPLVSSFSDGLCDVITRKQIEESCSDENLKGRYEGRVLLVSIDHWHRTLSLNENSIDGCNVSMLCHGNPSNKSESIDCCAFGVGFKHRCLENGCETWRWGSQVNASTTATAYFFWNSTPTTTTTEAGTTTARSPSLSCPEACNSTSSAACSKENCPHGCKCKRSIKKNIFIIGGIAVAGVLLLGLFVFLLVLRRKQILRSSRFSSARAPILSDGRGPQSPTVFTLKELKSATRSFSESKLLGGGGFSTVYQGKLTDGRIVAVKKLNQGNKQGIQQFHNERLILSKIRHPNLIQLLGYCLEGRDLLLVYEFVDNGPLADHLHGEIGNGLSLETRLRIALETAKALAYLHFDVSPPIYHRDVKSSNILLDKDFRVKVADFGLSRLTHLDATHISTAPQGTPGYLDPDYHESYQLTDKSDVYSFGVVLLELISRKKAVDMTRDRKEINLASMALAKIHGGALHELFDPELSLKYWKVLSRLAEVAFRCLATEKDDRPNMLEVVADLEQITSMMKGINSTKIQVDQHSSTTPADSKRPRILINCLDQDSPTSVQVKWPSTHTSPNNSRSEM